MTKCNICGHETHTFGIYLDCGGDCMLCMARADDPTCIDSVVSLAKLYHQALNDIKANLYRGLTADMQIIQARAIEQVLKENPPE